VTNPRPKRWRIAPPAPEAYVERLGKFDVHPVLAHLLHRRGFETADAALEFLGHYGEDDNPFRLKGMVEAVFRLRMAIRHGEPIAVYGDFDCDGVTATALLTQALARLGADVRPYIPDRVDEGYGLNSPALKSLADDGVRVVVTVDCGIRSVQEVEDGISYGLDMIVSDHHSVGKNIPPALAVINPKQVDCPYPEKMLAGVGLAYKIAQGLYMEAQRRGYRSDDDWHPDDWLDLVAIGTVADIAPLVGENRMLVQRGLYRLNRPARAGLKTLYGEAGIKPGQVSSVTIGFGIGPRINAAGRLGSAMLAYNLLTEDDLWEAKRLAGQLDELNRERQQKTADMQAMAAESFPGDPADEPLLFAADARFEQGIVGLVASRLTEQYYRPSVVVQLGEEESHGSCRSIPEFHITEALEQCEGLLERFGGHAAAAGFTVRNENIDALAEELWAIAADELADQELLPELEIDTELPLGEATAELAEALLRLEPTGEANPPPLFVTRGVRLTDCVAVGSDGNHLRLTLDDGFTRLEGIAFRWGEQVAHLPERVDVAYHLEINTWNGQRRLQCNVQDIKPAENGGSA
jgi:single-stranded-DNA-specific exonuclease